MMAELGGLAFLVLLVAAIGAPVSVLVLGGRAMKASLIALFASATIALPLAASTEPTDFRGTAVIMAALLFAFGLVAINVAGAVRAPRRTR